MSVLLAVDIWYGIPFLKQEFRRRAGSLEKQRQAEMEELKLLLGRRGGSDLGRDYSISPDSSDQGRSRSGFGGNGTSAVAGNAPAGIGESKMLYLRQMVLQYLSCKDPLVRPHIESALVAMLRVSEVERAAIENRQREDTQDSISSLTAFLGTLAGSSNSSSS